MAKAMAAGGEIDAWCTKCKLDLNHRIIAMEGTAPKRVECLTCRGHHNYRRPKSADPPKKTRARAGAKKTSTRARVTAAAAAKAAQQQVWEDAIMGRTPQDFTPYAMTISLQTGQLVSHKKFGDGVVSELVEGGKATILFELGPKMLVYGR